MQETQEMWVRSLGWEDPLEKGMATHSSILAWRIPWTKEPAGLQSMGTERIWTRLSAHPFINFLDILHIFGLLVGVIFYLRFKIN